MLFLCFCVPLAFLAASVVEPRLALLLQQQLFLFLSFCFFLIFWVFQIAAASRAVKQHFSLRLCLCCRVLLQAARLQSCLRQIAQIPGTTSTSTSTSSSSSSSSSSGFALLLTPADAETLFLVVPEFFLFAAFCLLDSQPDRRAAAAAAAASPEAAASLFSRLTFSWTYTLIKKGEQQPLQPSDAYELLPRHTSQYQTQKLMAAWAAEERRLQQQQQRQQQQQQRRAAQSTAAATRSTTATPLSCLSTAAATEAATALLSDSERDHSSSSSSSCSSSSSSSSKVSLLRVLVRAYGLTCLGSAFLKLIYDLLQFVGPLVLKQLIHFLQTPEE
ncbi:hypothetical protein ETH_00021865, partial [Eimeria tenella]